MKKLLALVLAIASLLALAACGEASEPMSTIPQFAGKPTRKTLYNSNGTMHMTIFSYEYDKKGNETRSEQLFADGGAHTYTRENKYNWKGQLIRAELQMDNRDNGFITYEYNADGQVIRHVYTDNEFGEFSGVATYIYNEQGQLIRTDPAEGLEGPRHSTYEYDAQGLLIRENDYSYDNLTGYYLYEYE